MKRKKSLLFTVTARGPSREWLAKAISAIGDMMPDEADDMKLGRVASYTDPDGSVAVTLEEMEAPKRRRAVRK